MWDMILQGQYMVLVVPRLPVAQYPMEQAVLLTLEEELWDAALPFLMPKVQKTQIPVDLKNQLQLDLGVHHMT